MKFSKWNEPLGESSSETFQNILSIYKFQTRRLPLRDRDIYLNMWFFPLLKYVPLSLSVAFLYPLFYEFIIQPWKKGLQVWEVLFVLDFLCRFHQK